MTIVNIGIIYIEKSQATKLAVKIAVIVATIAKLKYILFSIANPQL